MKKLLYLALPLFILTGCFDGADDELPEPPPVFTATQTFNVSLTGAQQVPNVITEEMATATVELDANLKQIQASVDLSDVENVEAAHIHDGDLGFNGDVAFAFTADTNGVYRIAPTDISDALMADLQNGEWYINVHTTAYPDGEIRGQIVNDETVIVTFPLSGQQEVPAVDTAANGYAYAAVDQNDYELILTVRTTGVDNATMAHIHTGRVGTNGDVLVGLEQSDSMAGVWIVPDSTMIDQATFDVLAGGGHYVNVHTPEYPSGELRGQILTDNFVLATFDLSGQQEVPMVDTQASGDGYALVNTDDYMIEVVAVTSGVDFATMAHIHTGRIGNNGDVLVGLVQSANDLGTWMTPEDTRIDQATFEVLASGGHYVNVHTPENPGGELRGQILTDNFELATFGLSGAQEVPAVTTAASGMSYVLINTADYSVELVALTDGLDDATMAHIHSGRIGNNGDVLVGLEQVTDEPGKWVTPANTMIDADIYAVLASGGHYVNVHTPANPGGELRGQIISSDDYALFTFPLSGAQEVPAVTTTASGTGYALVGLSDFRLELQVLTSGVEDATVAHIHTGVAGENGPILLGLEQDPDNVNRWMAPAEAALTQTIFEVLGASGHYVNVHTPAFPGGEIRGQIE
jgi:hypothetical protein